MKWLTPAIFSLSLFLLASHCSPTRADDEKTYVKVEIKGVFLPRVAPAPYKRPGVEVENAECFELEMEGMPGGAPTKEQLENFKYKRVIISGRLELRRDNYPLVHVTKIELFKKNPAKK